MDINQFAVYQLKNILENRQMRFRPYKVLQEKGIQVRYKDYEQVYLGRMQPEDTPEGIRKRFDKQLPRTFKGHSISVSDVLVLNKGGVVTSYYVEKMALPSWQDSSGTVLPVRLCLSIPRIST